MKTRNTIFVTLVASALVIAWAVMVYGWTLEGLQATTRFSGRLSLAVFACIFVLYPGHQERLKQLLSPGFFLVFAVVHGIHLIELVTYVTKSGISVVPMRAAGGFLAYSLIFAMPWLKTRAEQGKLTIERFQLIGNVYLFYVWFIFFMTYLARVRGSFPNAGGTYQEHAMLMGAVILILIVKSYQVLMRR